MRIAALVLAGAAALVAGSSAAARGSQPAPCGSAPSGQSAERGRLAPSLIGMSAEAAAHVLRSYNISPRRIGVTSPAPRGQVVDQWPKPGRFIMGGVVQLCISRGAPPAPPPAVLMPALRRLRLDQAVQTLTAQQILNRPQIVRVDHAEPQGEVFDQSPEAGTPVDAATAIVLQVSSGLSSPPPPILMPVLVGRTLGEAQQALSGLQIANHQTVAYAEHAEARGLVYHQSPEARAPLGADDTIVLDVSNGPATGAARVEVPSLAGLWEGAARALLERTGLVGVRGGSENSLLAAGQVVWSNPGARARVPRGSAVRYVLSLGPPAGSKGSILDWLADNPAALAALIVFAILAAAVVAKVLVPQRLKVTVHMPGPPLGKVEWGEPLVPAFELRVDPPKARMWRRAADPDEEGA